MAPHVPDSSDGRDDSFSDPYHRVYRIDQVRMKDLKDAIKLWERLGTHNGDPIHAKNLVAESEYSFREGRERFTLLGRKFDGFVGDIPRLTRAGIASVIYHDHAIPEGSQYYYVEDSGGFHLESLREDALELGGLYVEPEHRGKFKREIGVAMTMIRALLARKFEGLIGPHRAYADFLPPLQMGRIPEIKKDKDVALGNVFWFNLVYPALQELGVIGPISQYCSGLLDGNYAKTPEHLYYQLLVQLEPKNLNYIFATFFPKELKVSAETHARVRHILDNFGRETRGAQVNVAHSYPDLNRVGYNPVDAGQNWAGSIDHGALGDCTVPVEVLDGTEADMVYRTPGSQSALILKPVDGTRHDLQRFRAVVTPGIFSDRLARVPRDSLRLLDANMPPEITYRVLPTKSPTPESDPA